MYRIFSDDNDTFCFLSFIEVSFEDVGHMYYDHMYGIFPVYGNIVKLTYFELSA